MSVTYIGIEPATDAIGANELTQLAGISYRQLDYWTRSGTVHAIPRSDPREPLIDAGSPVYGSGYPRWYESTEARVVVLMADLVRAGVTPKKARPLADELLKYGTGKLGNFTIEAAGA
jgi:hypothetical protein